MKPVWNLPELELEEIVKLSDVNVGAELMPLKVYWVHFPLHPQQTLFYLMFVMILSTLSDLDK